MDLLNMPYRLYHELYARSKIESIEYEQKERERKLQEAKELARGNKQYKAPVEVPSGISTDDIEDLFDT